VDTVLDDVVDVVAEVSVAVVDVDEHRPHSFGHLKRVVSPKLSSLLQLSVGRHVLEQPGESTQLFPSVNVVVKKRNLGLSVEVVIVDEVAVVVELCPDVTSNSARLHTIAKMTFSFMFPFRSPFA
jgi:hypothetical protein